MSALVHDALVYEGTDDFVEHLVPYVRDALELGEGVLVVTPQRKESALREALGAEAAHVDWRDRASWYTSPGKVFNAWAAYAAEHDGGPRLRLVGEPSWPTAAPEAVAEWARYEAAINVALADMDLACLCLYDATELPEEIVQHALHTHPTLHTHGGRVLSDGYTDPGEVAAGFDGLLLDAPPHARLYGVSADLAGLRACTARDAAEAGVPRERIPELELALHELAINALTHGGGRATVRTWTDGGDFVCEIADEGPGLPDRHLGYCVPNDGDVRGRGIWLARQLCDFVQLASAPGGGTRVRLRVARA